MKEVVGVVVEVDAVVRRHFTPEQGRGVGVT